MVYYDHNRIMATRRNEISDEINRKLFERKDSGGRNRHKWRDGRMSVNLVLLADGTTIDEMFYKGSKAQPPKVMFKDGLGVKNTHMTSCRGGVN